MHYDLGTFVVKPQRPPLKSLPQRPKHYPHISKLSIGAGFRAVPRVDVTVVDDWAGLQCVGSSQGWAVGRGRAVRTIFVVKQLLYLVGVF